VLGKAQFRDIFKSMKKRDSCRTYKRSCFGFLFGILAYIFEWNVILTVIAGTALGVNVLVEGIIGSSMPFLIKKVGKDPAMMTVTVLTTVKDITGISIYLGLSTVFLIHMI